MDWRFTDFALTDSSPHMCISCMLDKTSVAGFVGVNRTNITVLGVIKQLLMLPLSLYFLDDIERRVNHVEIDFRFLLFFQS